MKKEEIKELLKNFGLSESAANYYANRDIEDKNFAWFAAFRFVRPLKERHILYEKRKL